MNNKLTSLAKRREHLIAEAATQRLMLTQHIEPLRATLVLADRGLAAVRYIKSHPAWMVSASLVFLTVMRSSQVGKWLQLGWLVWQVLRRLGTK